MFGDWNEKEKKIDDQVKTDNKDTQKVLATVTGIILHFTKMHPDFPIFIKGNNSARNRLFQMSMIKYQDQINNIFEVYGLVEESHMEPIVSNKKYSAFVIRRKKL